MRMGGLVAIIIIVAALAAGYYWYQHNYTNKSVPINTPTDSVNNGY